MASSWGHFGEVANVAQLTGVDAVRLIAMIVKAANTARMHKKNCRQFAQHLKLIGNLLEQLKISELKRYPETREPLEQLEDALRRSYILERLEVIEQDQREYTLDDDCQKLQTVILKPEPDKEDSVVLKKTLSCSYPNVPFSEALKKENEKLQLELQYSQAIMDIHQCEFIQRLLDITEVAAYSPEKAHKRVEYSNYSYSDAGGGGKGHSPAEKEKPYKKSDTFPASRSPAPEKDLPSTGGSYQQEDWHTDLLACCSEPCLCIKTCFFPCGTLSKIATVATYRPISSAETCNDLLAYSLILSCCCYTCCIRRKLRKMFNITGGYVDDFLSHFMCCCCALVQEWREVEIRGAYGSEKIKTVPPPLQYMES
ncbi:hypothetical protein PIB30_029208 [Stylosanthes scabra]|uniref:MCAfunc domain-containing protein n=1 Tax=Stylosanthes scabra TaxID=79078 RepID=A0ABU6RBD8_9FABA|nr:hypothetical protein [Stylosanthes scabra]